MRRVKLLIISLILFFVSNFVTGCVVRTYTLDKERVDQELVGNRGYIKGNPPPYEGKRKTSRQTAVVEIELGQPQIK